MFKSAGSIFTSGTHVLAGYQKDHTCPTVSGIGGKREGAETYMETAIRETVEELFGLDTVPPALVSKLTASLPPRGLHCIASYVMIVYNFNDLQEMIEIVKRKVGHSPLYKAFPKNVTDLVLKRRTDVVPRPEVLHLSLLPLVKNFSLDADFLEDIEIVLKEASMFHR